MTNTNKIHHNTLKRAAKLGVTLTHVKGHAEGDTGSFNATHPDVTGHQNGKTPSDALDLIALSLGHRGAKKPVAAKVAKRVGKPAKTPKKAEPKAEDKAAVPSNRSVVKKAYKERYAKLGGNSGTPISKALSDALLGEGASILPRIAKENNIPWIYQSLDTGRQRMCLGTILKGMDRRGEQVRILGKKYTNG